MTCAALLKRLQKLTPGQLRQKVKLKEGCSGNVTEVCGFYVQKKTSMRQDLVNNADGKRDKDGCLTHWLDTNEVEFEKGQVWLLHDH